MPRFGHLKTLPKPSWTPLEIYKYTFQRTTPITPTDRNVNAANATRYVPFVLSAEFTIKRLLWRTGSVGGNGNYDIGLYDSDAEGEPDSRLTSLGSTVYPAANTNVVSNIADQTIGPGLFYVAWVASSASDRMVAFLASFDEYRHGMYGDWGQTSALPLPATATPTRSITGQLNFIPSVSMVRDV